MGLCLPPGLIDAEDDIAFKDEGIGGWLRLKMIFYGLREVEGEDVGRALDAGVLLVELSHLLVRDDSKGEPRLDHPAEV